MYRVFVPRKRLTDLVLALATLHDQGVPFRATLAGDGPARRDVQELAREHGLADVVVFPGRLDNRQVDDLLSGALVFCLPSLWEGMPCAVMEAMARGIAVVGTNVNGTRELVVDGETGRLVPPKSPPAIAAAIAELVCAPEKAVAMGEAGRRRVQVEFSLDAMVARKQQLYLRVAGA